MVFIGGWGSGSKILGNGPILECENCHNENHFQVRESSKKATLYFIPVAKWDKHYWLVCPICQYGVELDSIEQARAIIELAAAEMPPLTFNENGTLRESMASADSSDDAPELPGQEAGERYIYRVMMEAVRREIPINDGQVWLLKQNPASVQEWLEENPEVEEEWVREQLRELNTICVELIRSAIEHEKSEGIECIEVRRGLRIPSDWEDDYQDMHESNLPWFISAFAQNAFLGNPLANEKGPWISE